MNLPLDSKACCTVSAARCRSNSELRPVLPPFVPCRMVTRPSPSGFVCPNGHRQPGLLRLARQSCRTTPRARLGRRTTVDPVERPVAAPVRPAAVRLLPFLPAARCAGRVRHRPVRACGAERRGHVLAPRNRRLDPRPPCGAAHRSVLVHDGGPAAGRSRMAVRSVDSARVPRGRLERRRTPIRLRARARDDPCPHRRRHVQRAGTRRPSLLAQLEPVLRCRDSDNVVHATWRKQTAAPVSPARDASRRADRRMAAAGSRDAAPARTCTRGVGVRDGVPTCAGTAGAAADRARARLPRLPASSTRDAGRYRRRRYAGRATRSQLRRAARGRNDPRYYGGQPLRLRARSHAPHCALRIRSCAATIRYRPSPRSRLFPPPAWTHRFSTATNSAATWSSGT